MGITGWRGTRINPSRVPVSSLSGSARTSPRASQSCKEIRRDRVLTPLHRVDQGFPDLLHFVVQGASLSDHSREVFHSPLQVAHTRARQAACVKERRVLRLKPNGDVASEKDQISMPPDALHPSTGDLQVRGGMSSGRLRKPLGEADGSRQIPRDQGDLMTRSPTPVRRQFRSSNVLR